MASKQPPGTFLPGTKVQVGNQRVVIDKYLSEGGFAHVYVVRTPRDGQVAVLKRVAVPDKEHLATMRTEVETMKKLKGHKHVVTYMDSHANQMKGGGYEVFLLMEFCSGGGLIDFMNTRLQHRLTEPEILKIFGDVAEGLACMHYLRPPLLHRDLKVENVLIGKSSSGGSPIYKLCDFGSTAAPRPAAKTAEEGRLIEEDVQKNTTMQYRSPEMIDVWRKQPINEKADIWALGVFLYKLCYYTTPFEDVGQMAILNASYKFPSYPAFSPRLRKLITSMLMEDPKARPNIYQVIKDVCTMRNVEVPIKDIYANRTASEARRNESLPTTEPSVSPPAAIGLQKSAPQKVVQSIPEVSPMRRGRPTAPTATKSSATKGDPFAALDSKNFATRSGAVDELSNKFPSLDDFTIAHDKNDAFDFSSKKPAGKSATNEPTTRALADEVFAKPRPPVNAPKPATSGLPVQPSKLAAAKAASLTKARETLQNSPLIHEPTPVRPGNDKYKSTGVGSSPPPEPKKLNLPEISKRPIWRVPEHNRSSSQPRASSDADNRPSSTQPSGSGDVHRSKSQLSALQQGKPTTSSRPSLEGHRPSQLELQDDSLGRAKSAQNRSRPTSMYVNSGKDQSRDQEAEDIGVTAGKFGGAFSRFQQDGKASKPAVVSPAPAEELIPGLGEEPTVEVKEVESPGIQHELERQRLNEEERRVSEAAAEYRARVSTQGSGSGSGAPPARSNAIQQRMQSYLEEGRQSPAPKKTAEGYGRYTGIPDQEPSSAGATTKAAPPVARKPPAVVAVSNSTISKSKPVSPVNATGTGASLKPTISAPSTAPIQANSLPTRARPSVPVKSATLRTGGSSKWPPQFDAIEAPVAEKQQSRATGLAALLAKDLEGVPDYPPRGSSLASPIELAEALPSSSRQEKSDALVPDDDEAEFSKRYPSLAGIEQEMSGGGQPTMREV